MSAIPFGSVLIRRPGIYHLPQLLGLGTLLVAFFGLLLNGVIPENWRGDLPLLYRLPATSAFAFLMLAFSMRMKRDERRARILRLVAGAASLLCFLDTVLSGQLGLRGETPLLIAASLCMLAAAMIMQATQESELGRRGLIVASLIVAFWLGLVNVSGANDQLGSVLTSDPVSAGLLLCLSLALLLRETAAEFVPIDLRRLLNPEAAWGLLAGAVGVPMLLGALRLKAERNWGWTTGEGSAVHMALTLVVMGSLIVYSLTRSSERQERQEVFTRLLAGTSDFFLTLSSKRDVLAMNESARHSLGIKGGVLGLGLADILDDESRLRVVQLAADLERHESVSSVLSFVGQHGDPLQIQVTMAMRPGMNEEILLVGRVLPLGLQTAPLRRLTA